MKQQELYTHTRNYGCRYKLYTQNGVEMLSLENARIKVVFALGKGADIVEFMHKPTDVDFMWHSFNELKHVNQVSTVASTGGNFMDSYAGGWQELFPTYGAGTKYHGGQIGIHGEACLYPWQCSIVMDTPECVEVLLSLRTIRSPFLLEKRVTIREDSSALVMEQKVTNLSMRELDFMWGHHPAFGFPFLDESVEIRVNGAPKVTVPTSTVGGKYCPFEKETVGTWPVLTDKNGLLIDVSKARGTDEKLYMEFGISDLKEGQCEVVSRNKGIGMRMQWDPDVFRYIWIWAVYHGLEEYPWYGRSYVLGVEPWSSMPANYMVAKEADTLLHIAGGASLKTQFVAEIFEDK